MPRRFLIATLLLLSACKGVGGAPSGGDPAPGGDPVPGDPLDGDPTSGDPILGGTTIEFAECFAAGDCMAGLTCTPWPAGPSPRASYCLRQCQPQTPTACTADQVCPPADTADGYGRCLRKVGYFQECDAYFDACSADALCFGAALPAPLRCLPICDLGPLPPALYRVYQGASECPPLGMDVQALGPTCTPGLVTGAKLCAALVAAGEPCDEAALLCNRDAQRPDTDPATSPSTPDASGFDPGSLSCVAHGAGLRCERICNTADGVPPSASCVCPEAESCAYPLGDGVTMSTADSCQRWPELKAGVRGCVPIEDCTGNAAACDDNLTTGLTACLPSPYVPAAGQTIAPAWICQRP